MHIKTKNIKPGLRLKGELYRIISPNPSVKLFKTANSILKRYGKNKWKSNTTYFTEKFIKVKSNTIRIGIVRSRKESNKLKTGLLWIHGGGFATGIPEQSKIYGDLLVADGTSVMIIPDYCKSVDAPYPAALNDCYDSLKWMIENSKELGIRDDQIFVGGVSAGGGLTASLCIYARDKKEVSIAYQMPLYPMLDHRKTNSSCDNDAPVWNTKYNDVAWNLYLKSIQNTNEIPAYASPALNTKYNSLPPACTFIGSIDPFYDETIDFVNKLKNEKIPVSIKVFDGCYHSFEKVAKKTKISKEALSFIKQNFKYAQEKFYKKQPINKKNKA